MSSNKSTQQKDRIWFLHSKEWVVFAILWLAAFLFRVGIGRTHLRDANVALLRQMKNAHDLSYLLVEQCRLDIDALCREPQGFLGIPEGQILDNGQPKFFSLVVVRHDPAECQTLPIPNPFYSLMSPFISTSCPGTLEPRESNGDPKEIYQDIVELAIQQLHNDYRIAANPSGSSRYEFSLKSTPALRSRFLLNENVRARVMLVFLQAFLDTITGASALEALTPPSPQNKDTIVFMPESIRVPIGALSRDTLIDMLDEAVHGFSKRHTSEEDAKVVSIMLRVIQQAASKSQTTTLKELSPLPEFPFTNAGPEKSECIRRLYQTDSLLSESCRKTIAVAAPVIDELEFQLDFPVAAIVLYFYIIMAIYLVFSIQSRLGGFETNKQRERRHFVQTLKDPVLRRGLELDAIKARGEEEAAKMMESLDARAARYEAESAADDEWKKQAVLTAAWKKRIRQVKLARIGLGVLCLISLALLSWDRPKVGRVLDGMLVLLTAFLVTYFCLPVSPQTTTKKTEMDVPLLSDAT